MAVSLDNELFKLCKEVYKQTGWKPDAVYEGVIERGENMVRGHLLLLLPGNTPLYTADFLLEKLPAEIRSKEYENSFANLWMRKDSDYGESDRYFAFYVVMNKQDAVSDFGVHAQTPASALLKLTIALHEAGELPINNKTEGE